MSESNSLILVVSDVHIGALKSEIDSFNQFLKDINNGEFGNELKALIILGDFFDLCTDIPKSLLEDEKIQNIFTLLLEIKKKINVIFVLGNHEIPVTGNIFTGTYDQKFQSRKEKFLAKFKNGNFDKLFNEAFFCQYIALKKLKNKDMLLLYDSRDQIFDDPITKIKIDGLDLESDYICLMMHGYQFDSGIFRFFVGPIWKSLISLDNIDIKEAFDYFWNEIIKGKKEIKPITFEAMKEELAVLKNLPPEIIDSHLSRLGTLDFKIIKLKMRVMKEWESSRVYEYYSDGIKNFLEDDEYDFSKVNHVIYGHSHNMGKTSETIINHPVEIINDGAWQHVTPSYIRILRKGEIVLEHMPELIAPPI